MQLTGGLHTSSLRYSCEVRTARTVAMPQGEEFVTRVDELKASFHAINEEDKPITCAIAHNAAALSAQPGRLSPKEQTIWEFQRYLARMLTA